MTRALNQIPKSTGINWFCATFQRAQPEVEKTVFCLFHTKPIMYVNISKCKHKQMWQI